MRAINTSFDLLPTLTTLTGFVAGKVGKFGQSVFGKEVTMSHAHFYHLWSMPLRKQYSENSAQILPFLLIGLVWQAMFG